MYEYRIMRKALDDFNYPNKMMKDPEWLDETGLKDDTIIKKFNSAEPDLTVEDCGYVIPEWEYLVRLEPIVCPRD